MPENNPFSSPNSKPRPNDGVFDIDKIIEQEKVHAHKNAAPIPEPVAPVAPVEPEPQAAPMFRADEPKVDILEDRPTALAEANTGRAEVEDLPEVNTVPEAEEFVDDEPSEADMDERYDDEPEETEVEPEVDEEPTETPEIQPRYRRYVPRDVENTAEAPEFPEESPVQTDDIILGAPKNTPNRRNIILMLVGAAVACLLVFLIPQLINGGVLFKSSDTGTTGTPGTPSDSTNVTAGLSKDVKLKKVSDGLEADDPDNWEVTLTADTTDITLSLDCTPKQGGGTTPNLSCVSAGGGDVVDGTFVKPFTAGEGWEYVDGYYGYCYSFADKVSAKTVQSELYGSSGIQLFYMADDFRICSKKAGNPNDTPKGTPCLNEQAYCPAVRLSTIK
jgi:hypothetical protein